VCVCVCVCVKQVRDHISGTARPIVNLHQIFEMLVNLV